MVDRVAGLITKEECQKEVTKLLDTYDQYLQNAVGIKLFLKPGSKITKPPMAERNYGRVKSQYS